MVEHLGVVFDCGHFVKRPLCHFTQLGAAQHRIADHTYRADGHGAYGDGQFHRGFKFEGTAWDGKAKVSHDIDEFVVPLPALLFGVKSFVGDQRGEVEGILHIMTALRRHARAEGKQVAVYQDGGIGGGDLGCIGHWKLLDGCPLSQGQSP
ncbi:hypothetical protein D9M71_385630 [compost metagenome]